MYRGRGMWNNSDDVDLLVVEAVYIDTHTHTYICVCIIYIKEREKS